MKHLTIFSLLITFCFVQVNGQDSTDTRVFTFVEQMPEFAGGDAALVTFIGENIRYPQLERDNNIEGKVFIRFVVMEDGSVDSVEVIRSVSPGIDAEALRVVRMLPKFAKPGYQQGKAVKVYYTLPISFNLTGPEPKSIDKKKKGKQS
ncbi:MAG: energy transducer TonB [Chitinophagales bacterium]|nr:energy transducer TonB [Chitinophagales bacterium]